MPPTPIGKISRATALRLLKQARELMGTPDSPDGPYAPELDPFIRNLRVISKVHGKKEIIEVEFRFDLAPLPALSADDRYDFNEVLAHDAQRRFLALGIEVFSSWRSMRSTTIVATTPKHRRKVEKMMDVWKRFHRRPGAK
jgi:hypothetical protein